MCIWLLVEWDRSAKEGVDDIGVVVQLLVHHEGEDAHLSGTSIVELDCCLGLLFVSGPSQAVHVVVAVLLDSLLDTSESILDGSDE